MGHFENRNHTHSKACCSHINKRSRYCHRINTVCFADSGQAEKVWLFSYRREGGAAEVQPSVCTNSDVKQKCWGLYTFTADKKLPREGASAWKETLLEQMYPCLPGNSGSAALWLQHTSVELVPLAPDAAVSLTNLQACIHIMYYFTVSWFSRRAPIWGGKGLSPNFRGYFKIILISFFFVLHHRSVSKDGAIFEHYLLRRADIRLAE